LKKNKRNELDLNDRIEKYKNIDKMTKKNNKKSKEEGPK
jgi:hypothetical protein